MPGTEDIFRVSIQWYQDTMNELKLNGDATTACLLLHVTLD